MGSKAPIARMAWISDLAGMQRHGTLLKAGCRDPGCAHWTGLDVSALIVEYGEETDLRDADLRCDSCGGAVLILASPGQGTPFRPVR